MISFNHTFLVNKPKRSNERSMSLEVNAFHTLKLLKACNYCRRRKIKCVLNQNSQICENCKHHGITCHFDHKTMNGKKEKVVAEPPKNFNQYSKDLYASNIKPYTPFVSDELFDLPQLDDFCRCCINIASVSSPQNIIPESKSALFSEQYEQLMKNNVPWNKVRLSCFFLLPLRAVIPQYQVQDALAAFKELSLEEVSDELVAAACTVDAWNSLFTNTPLATRSKHLIERFSIYLASLDTTSFAYHFLYVGYFLYKFTWVISEKLSYEETKALILQLEFDMLLWPAKLTRHLSVITDALLASPEAFILHVLHNTLLTFYYTKLVLHEDSYGLMVSLSAVPGLYNFISGMARSNFVVKESIVTRWSITVDCQTSMAKQLLVLNNVMDFHDFKMALLHFNKHQNVSNKTLQDETYERVQKLLQERNITLDTEVDVDGSKLYWTFRDVRSMTLQIYVNEGKRSSISDAYLS